MPHPEFAPFTEVIESLFSIRSGNKTKAIVLRKMLGTSLDERLSRLPKGTIQEKKSHFIKFAKIISGIEWQAREPHKIITTLKITGDGDEDMTVALFFLCYKIKEFSNLRKTLHKALTIDLADQRHVEGWPPTVEFRFDMFTEGGWSDVYAKLRDKLQPAMHLSRKIGEATRELDESKSTFRYLIDNDVKNGVDFKNTEEAIAEISLRARLDKSNRYAAQMEGSAEEEKSSGRSFVETETEKFIVENSEGDTGTLSIIDIDGLTQINKRYGLEVGNIVISLVELIVEHTVKDTKNKVGRCGDDTFFVVLAGENVDSTQRIMNTVKSQIQNYEWESEASELRVSVSIGIADRKLFENSIDLAIRAGLGMKSAKASGGNNVTFGPNFLPHSNVGKRPSTLIIWS